KAPIRSGFRTPVESTGLPPFPDSRREILRCEGNSKSRTKRSGFSARFSPRFSGFHADHELDLLPALFADLLRLLQEEFLEFLAGETVNGFAGILQSLAKNPIEFINFAGFALQIGTSNGYRWRYCSLLRPGPLGFDFSCRGAEMPLHLSFLSPLHAFVENFAVLDVGLGQVAIAKSLAVIHFRGAVAIAFDHLLDSPFNFGRRPFLAAPE